MTACLDVDGLADCLIGYHQDRAREEILETYAKVRRYIFLKYVDARSIKNLKRVSNTDPWTVLDTDPFFDIIKELNKDKQTLKDFLLVSLTRIAFVHNLRRSTWRHPKQFSTLYAIHYISLDH